LESTLNRGISNYLREIADVKDRRSHANNALYWLTEPKGMHGETFADLLTDLEDARKE